MLYVRIGRPRAAPLISLRFDRIVRFESEGDALRIMGAFPDLAEVPTALLERTLAANGRGFDIVRLGPFDGAITSTTVGFTSRISAARTAPSSTE